MALSYGFGGDTGMTQEDLRRRQAMARLMMRRGASGQPKTAIQGVNSAANSILGALMAKKMEGQVPVDAPQQANPTAPMLQSLMAGGAGGMAGDEMADPVMQLGLDPVDEQELRGLAAPDMQDAIRRIQQGETARDVLTPEGAGDPRGMMWQDDLMLGGGGADLMTGGTGDDYMQGGDVKAIKKGAGNNTAALKIKHSLMSFMEGLDDYESIYGKSGGAVVPGADKDKLSTQRRALQMQMKELYNLGVLNGPDLDLLNEMMVDPTAIGPNVLNFLGVSDLDERVRANVAHIRDIMKDLAAPQLREYGISVDDIASKRRPAAELSDADFLKSLGLE